MTWLNSKCSGDLGGHDTSIKKTVNRKENSQKIVRKAKRRTWAYRTIKGTFGYHSGHPMNGLSQKKHSKKK